MSPFCRVFRDLRLRHGMRQCELARRLGYEQAYISSIEIGLKGPPTDQFIQALIRELNLSPEEKNELQESVVASERKLVLDNDMHEEHFWMISDLREQLATLHPRQIRMIREIINMREFILEAPVIEARRIRRRSKTEANM
nr:helix-turn-helix transcriptional regulator [uncultured Undibacterium sp.]